MATNANRLSNVQRLSGRSSAEHRAGIQLDRMAQSKELVELVAGLVW